MIALLIAATLWLPPPPLTPTSASVISKAANMVWVPYTPRSHPLHHRPLSDKALAWRIISHTFPKSTRTSAWRVAGCETSHFTDFWNDSSSAKDMFQEMPGNHGRVFHWHGRWLRLNWNHLSGDGPTWYSAQIALLQSSGGWDWGEWSCKP